MKKTTLSYYDLDTHYQQCVLIDKITHLSKTLNGDVTIIHLENGKALRAEESIKTLEARINTELT